MHCSHHSSRNHQEKKSHILKARNTEGEEGGWKQQVKEKLLFEFSRPIGGLDLMGLTNESEAEEEEEKYGGALHSPSSRNKAQSLTTAPRI